VTDLELLRAEAASNPYPLLFATISGAHLYGFPLPDSDFDLRGAHILPVEEAVGLLPKRETLQVEGNRNGIELDLVTHDILKFFSMLLKRNGYVLEQLYSPLIVQSGPEHEELKEIAKGCVTRYHNHHYLGFAATQWELFQKEDRPRVKPLLYVYRVLLTGIHLMRTGRIEANLIELNQEYRLPYISDLVGRKIHGAEKSTLEIPEIDFHRREYESLIARLQTAGVESSLPDEPTSQGKLNDLLIRVRLQYLHRI
jgi:predicted nucleotidyltransferase